MEQRFYFDTSVFGGLFDQEFEEETTLLFEKIRLGQIKCVYSNLTESELTMHLNELGISFKIYQMSLKKKF